LKSRGVNDLSNTIVDSWYEEKLLQRKEQQSLRALTAPAGKLDFTSNDYLGLARSEEIYEETLKRLRNLHLKKNGATGSRLLSGNSAYTQQVETSLAERFKADAALIFNSGYSANLAVLSSIPQRGDTILYDELAHACIKDGARLSLAQRFSFHHNDLADLEQKIKRATGRIFIAVESIYSMDGDQCPLAELVKIAESSGATIILDEAHSTGVLGAGGSGLAVSVGLEKKIGIRVYTFGKAMGVHGACVVGSAPLCEYLINFARPFIYTTALPPHSIASIECAFNSLDNSPGLQSLLAEKIKLFQNSVTDMSNRTTSNSAIQTALFPGNENVRRAAAYFQERGFDIRPILSPTVPLGEERLRICLHTYNEDDDIKKLGEWLLARNAGEKD
jgi:8-amino-7-oxononanoate synthase